MKPKKNVGLAVILSGFVPGLGQVYNGQPLKGLAFFLTSYFLLFPWPFAVTDAWETATKINQAETSKLYSSNRSNSTSNTTPKAA